MTDSQDNRNEAPYAVAAMRYRAAGWEGVLPLPADAKFPPPPGFTGRRHAGMYPSVTDIQTWIMHGMNGAGRLVDVPAGNIALRLPPDVVGLDVDAYDGKPGGETLAKLEAALGPLPPTWVSTSRHDGVSGIRLYRLPAGVREGDPGRRWLDEAGPGVDIIRHGHRYAVVAPSVVEGREYRWCGADVGTVPTLDDLSSLSMAWVDHLAPAGERRAAPVGVEELDEAGAREWLGACRDDDGEPCGVIMAVLTEARRALAARGAAGSRHETALGASRAIAAYGGEGHNRAVSALSALGAAFEESTRGEGRGGEWRSMLVGAVALARRAHPTPEGKCTCDAFIVPLDFSPPPEAGGQMAGTEMYPQGVENPVDGLLGELLTAEQVANRPNPVPLINGLLDLDSMAWLIGKPGSFKSFVALTLAGHVGAGMDWGGRRVHQGKVVYLVAEGVTGMSLRVRAWQKHFGPMRDVLFLPRPVQARGQEWSTLVEAVARVRPVLVVLDTQARVSVGIDENDNTAMGMFIEQAERLRRACGGCVLVVHHIGRGGDDARGASAIDGAQGTELKVERIGGMLAARLRMDKQKDQADTGVIDLEMVVVDGGTDDETGRDLSSLVAALPVFATAGGSRPWRDDLPKNQANIVDVLYEHFGMLGGTYARVKAIVDERFGVMPKSSYSTAWKVLVEGGVIMRVESTERYVLASLNEG